MPHGTIRSKYDRSVVTLSAKPCQVTQSRACTPIDAIFRPAVQTPVSPGLLSAVTPSVPSARMSSSSSWRRYQCRSCRWRLRSMMGYPTSCPGP